MTDTTHETALHDANARVFRLARTRSQHGLLLAAVLGLIGLAVLAVGEPTVPDAPLIGGLQLLIAAGISVSAIWMRRDRRPRLIVDGEGLWYHDWNLPKIPWAQVESVRMDGARVQGYVAVRLRDPEPFWAGLSEPERKRARGNRLLRDQELRILNGALDASLADVCETIRSAKADAGREARGVAA